MIGGSLPIITSFLVKVTSRCNLDCDYCYVYQHADQSWQTLPARMSSANQAAFTNRLATYVHQAGLKRCVVILHGGEPLLLGANNLAEFAQLLRRGVGPEVEVDIGIQTNGLLLTDDALQILEAADIGVSLSLDGPQAVNDLHRRTPTGKSSFHYVMEAFRRLKDRPHVFSGTIAVVDPTVPPSELFEFFNAIQPPKIDFLLPDAHHLRPPPGRDQSPNIYQDWLIEAFDLWLDRYPKLQVRTFEALLDVFAGLPSGTDAFGFGDVSLITVETDGTYHDVDVLKVVKEGASRLVGSVNDTDIQDIARSNMIAQHRHLLRREGLCEQCRQCPVVDQCGGGSLPHRYSENGFDNPTVYCREMQALILHARARLEGELASEAIDAAPISIDMEAWESAETSGNILDRLILNSCAEQRIGLEEALDWVRANEITYADLAIQLKNSASLDALSMQPGIIAWQRAIHARMSGRSIYTVDGSELLATGDYLNYWTNRNLAQNRLDIASEDMWLRAPFGNSIFFEPASVAANAMAVLEDAFEIIRNWRPALADEMRKASHAVQFIRDPAASPDKIVSFSDNSVPGTLYVSVLQREELISPYDLADSLIHEHRHQKLYLLERISPTVLPTTMKVVSPWREDLRPPSGLFHAVFVFVELRRFWRHVKETGSFNLRSRSINQLDEIDSRLGLAFQILDQCPLTEKGKALLTILYSRHKQDILAK